MRGITTLHFTAILLIAQVVVVGGCSETIGDPVDEDALGYKVCTTDRFCGPGRYCRKAGGAEEGYCWSDCRPGEGDKDCVFLGEGLECTVFGQCVPEGEDLTCMNSDDCADDRYCNRTTNVCEKPDPCQSSSDCSGDTVCAGRVCTPTCGVDIIDVEGVPVEQGRHEDCPEGQYCNASVKVRGDATCSPFCRTDLDCEGYGGSGIACVPIGLCLEPGVDWYEPGECRWVIDGHRVDRLFADSPCTELGWNFACRPGSDTSVCEQVSDEVDFGEVDPSYEASKLVGTWGLYFQTSSVNDVPLIGSQNVVSSNASLARLTHEGNQVQIEIKICSVELINFWDDDLQHENLSWMVLPKRYHQAVPMLIQTVEVDEVGPGVPFETTWLHDVRGAWLDDPFDDPLPTMKDLSAAWDQDMDGNPGLTTVMEGLLHGDVYNCQRWGDRKLGTIHDARPKYISGLLSTFTEQFALGANPSELAQDAAISVHLDPDRTFFRMERLEDRATCEEVVARKHREGDWLSYTAHYGDLPVPAE